VDFGGNIFREPAWGTAEHRVWLRTPSPQLPGQSDDEYLAYCRGYRAFWALSDALRRETHR
jgi:hypothetical protein